MALKRLYDMMPKMSKDTAKYWHKRIVKRTYVYKGQKREYLNWYMRVQRNGQRVYLDLGTANRADAAQVAAEKYAALRDGLLTPKKTAPKVLTLGAFLDFAFRRLTADAGALESYGERLLKFGRAIAGIEKAPGRAGPAGAA